MPSLATLDRLRHRVPFWWWLTYDALVAVVIVFGVSPHEPAFWLGFAVLGVAVVIDAVEFLVKRPGAVPHVLECHPPPRFPLDFLHLHPIAGDSRRSRPARA